MAVSLSSEIFFGNSLIADKFFDLGGSSVYNLELDFHSRGATSLLMRTETAVLRTGLPS